MTNSIIPNSLILKLLPQKAPFVMLSHLINISETKITTGFHIPTDNIFVDQHKFSANGMIENIAQSVALFTSYADYLKNKVSPVGYIGSISNIEVFLLPEAESFIRTEVEVVAEFMGVTLIQGTVFSNGEKAISLKMKTILEDQVNQK